MSSLLELKDLIHKSKKGIRVTRVKRFLKLTDSQMQRLLDTEVLKLTKSGKSVKDLVVKPSKLGEVLSKRLIVIKRSGRFDTEVNYGVQTRDPSQCYRFHKYGVDWDFILAAIEAYTREGKSGSDAVFADRHQRETFAKTTQRAAALDMDGTQYQRDKELGKVDWDYGKVYDVRITSQDIGSDYQWRYNGQEYIIRETSLYWRSHSELYNKFCRQNPENFEWALEALFKHEGHQLHEVNTPEPGSRIRERHRVADLRQERRMNRRENDLFIKRNGHGQRVSHSRVYPSLNVYK